MPGRVRAHGDPGNGAEHGRTIGRVAEVNRRLDGDGELGGEDGGLAG